MFKCHIFAHTHAGTLQLFKYHLFCTCVYHKCIIYVHTYFSLSYVLFLYSSVKHFRSMSQCAFGRWLKLSVPSEIKAAHNAILRFGSAILRYVILRNCDMAV